MNCLVDVIIDIWYIDDDVISQKVWIKANKKIGISISFLNMKRWAQACYNTLFYMIRKTI